MNGRAGAWTAGQARAAFDAAPEVDLSALAGGGALIVVAPHPDDETLGCGGLIAEASAAGRCVVVALMTDGAASHPGSTRFDARGRAALRMAELRGALGALSDERIEIEAFSAPDGALADHLVGAGLWLRDLAERVGAGALFVTWEADPHSDHKAAFAAASSAATATGVALWAYPVWSLILPDSADVGSSRDVVSLDVGRHRARKRAAIAQHASQLDLSVMADPKGFVLRPEDVKRHERREIFLAIHERSEASTDSD